MKGFDAHEIRDFASNLGKNQLFFGGLKIILYETSSQLIPSKSEQNEIVLKAHKSGL